jgi:hypothetical protein
MLRDVLVIGIAWLALGCGDGGSAVDQAQPADLASSSDQAVRILAGRPTNDPACPATLPESATSPGTYACDWPTTRFCGYEMWSCSCHADGKLYCGAA